MHQKTADYHEARRRVKNLVSHVARKYGVEIAANRTTTLESFLKYTENEKR